MQVRPTRTARFGLIRPAIDAHSLGISSVGQLLRDCGYQVLVADGPTCTACDCPDAPESGAVIEHWLRQNQVTCLGVSYRLDPQAGVDVIGRLLHQLRGRRLLADQGGPITAVYFAGLPETCRRIQQQHPELAGVFAGDETPAETLAILGIPVAILPAELAAGMSYDESRLAFGRDLVAQGECGPSNP